ncbi:ABC transporter permease [Tissierella pigra]|uniref:ABC transporter permease n=1 Tax=Tissierella pigra TaxID=2607614 RepID=A0A6N7Y1P2_9FIRM|nr:ABC transporter permease [Tissierella pigra]MBU5428042.1 ABC transporter permease [Tissierella pigra]MSU02665.1 ABC transporter permease [Tissierella pigra]
MNSRLRGNLKYQLKQNKLGIIAVIVIAILLIASILAFLAPHDPNKIDIMNSLKSPNKEHIFGTDEMGRDYFARALYGGRVSLTVGFLSMIISTVIGTIVGTISGYFGGRIDSLIMRTIDILMSIPTFFLILILNAYLKPGIQNIIIIIGLFSWMGIARIVRGETLSVKEREYVLYSKVTGEKSRTIMLKHIIPNIFPTVIVASTLNIAGAILTESSLSFLGLGVRQPDSSWGSMLKYAQGYIGDAPYLALFPGILILLTVLSFNILGDIFRVAFEPKANND